MAGTSSTVIFNWCSTRDPQMCRWSMGTVYKMEESKRIKCRLITLQHNSTAELQLNNTTVKNNKSNITASSITMTFSFTRCSTVNFSTFPIIVRDDIKEKIAGLTENSIHNTPNSSQAMSIICMGRCIPPTIFMKRKEGRGVRISVTGEVALA